MSSPKKIAEPAQIVGGERQKQKKHKKLAEDSEVPQTALVTGLSTSPTVVVNQNNGLSASPKKDGFIPASQKFPPPNKSSNKPNVHNIQQPTKGFK